MRIERMISIWFFIGVLLHVYGVLILGAGVWEYFAPSEPAPVLSDLHAGIWWGLLVLFLGAFYTIRFRPR